MNENIYEGTSHTGSFSEALASAIAAAVQGVSATGFLWELDSLKGEQGGFVGANNITVRIKISQP